MKKPIISFKKRDTYIEYSNKNGALEKEIFEPNFYEHTDPDPVFYGENNMPMTIETPDSATTAQLLVDDGNGKERPMTADEARSLTSRVPDGINVPGYVKPGAKRPPQAPPQAPPQGNNTRQPRQPQQSQQPQQQQQQQPQIYPPQAFYQQQYTQPLPPQGYPPQNYPQQNYPPLQAMQPQQVPVQTAREDLVPPTEMILMNGEYHIFVDLAGVSKADLNIVYDNGTLKITGKRESAVDILKKQLKTGKGRKTIKESSTTVPEFLMGKFQYKYSFKRLIDESNVTAKYTDGILHVTLPHRTKGDQVSIALM